VAVAAAAVLAAAATAGAEPKVKEEKVDGYLEWRQGDLLIVDGQKVTTSAATKFKGKDAATSVASIPLGYEVKAKGERKADGSLLARELESKPNGSAMFEGDVKSMTDQAESEYRRAGRFFNQLEGGKTETVGWMFDSGPKVDRVRRIVDSLLPPYLDASQVRLYVIENKEWNAFAMGNYSIYVFSGIMDDLDDDELAIVLGHEIAHATHEHTRRQFKKAMWIQLAAIGLSAAAEEVDDKNKRAVAQLLVLFGAQAWSNGYGRDMEDQADRVGLRYAYEAGYDITKGPRLWQRFAKKYGEPGKVANFFFGNHSLSSARAVNLVRQRALNYPDGPKSGGVRTAATSNARTASGPQPGPLPPLSSSQGRGTALTGSSSTGPASASSSGPASAAAPSGGKKEIRPGMTQNEVRALLGKPKEEVAFGSKSIWTYPAFSVVFEAAKVVEVKF
jgi:Zn-dependent protease with chaperone function